MTDIIIRKNDIDFHLRWIAVSEVEKARISLTDLANLLGYKSNQGLQRLVDRHTDELAQLGGTDTVSVPIRAGNAPTRDFEELAFNQPQVMYLVGHADTPNARALSVQYVKGFFMLLEYVWRIETTKYEKPMTPAQLIFKQAELLVKMEAKAAEQEDSITANTVEAADLRKVQRVHTDAIQDLRSEVADTAAIAEALATKPKKATNAPKTPGVIRGTPSRTIPPLREMHTIATWAIKHRPANAPVLHSSLGRAASALYRDYYDGAIPSKSGLVEVDGIKRKVAVYPIHILQKAFRYTPRSKIGKKRKK